TYDIGTHIVDQTGIRAWVAPEEKAVGAISSIVGGNKNDTKDSDLGTLGRYVETPLERMSPEMLNAFEFTRKQRGAIAGPYKIRYSNPKLSKKIVPTGTYFQTQSTRTRAEIEITVYVINGHWLPAYSNHEHEIISENLGGLPPENIEALIPRLPTS